MSEDLAVDRILPPTHQRRQRARREGHVARSPQLTAAMIFLGTLLALKTLAPAMFASWRGTAEALMSSQQLGSTSPTGLSAALAGATWETAASLLLLLLLVMALAVLANVAQAGFLLAPQRLSLRLDAVSPSHNLLRILNGRSVLSAGGSLLKLTALVGVGWLAMRAEIPRLVMLQTLPIEEAVPAGAGIVMNVGLKLALVLLGLGLIDFGLARWRYEQNLRATPQEAREEARRTDGDPQIRARRRKVARQRSTAGRKAPEAVH